MIKCRKNSLRTSNISHDVMSRNNFWLRLNVRFRWFRGSYRAYRRESDKNLEPFHTNLAFCVCTLIANQHPGHCIRLAVWLAIIYSNIFGFNESERKF